MLDSMLRSVYPPWPAVLPLSALVVPAAQDSVQRASPIGGTVPVTPGVYREQIIVTQTHVSVA